jgi:hypothetical protein
MNPWIFDDVSLNLFTIVSGSLYGWGQKAFGIFQGPRSLSMGFLAMPMPQAFWHWHSTGHFAPGT